MDTLGILQGSDNPTAILFLVSGESRNYSIICSTSVSSCMLRDASDVKVDSGLPLFWCP